MIPTKPPPTLKCEADWSLDFVNFVGQCLVKNPDERKSAHDLLEVWKYVISRRRKFKEGQVYQ